MSFTEFVRDHRTVSNIVRDYIGSYEKVVESGEHGSVAYEVARDFLAQPHAELVTLVHSVTMASEHKEVPCEIIDQVLIEFGY